MYTHANVCRVLASNVVKVYHVVKSAKMVIFGNFEGQYLHREAEDTASEVLFRIKNCTTYVYCLERFRFLLRFSSQCSMLPDSVS